MKMSGICQRTFNLLKDNQMVEADLDSDDFINVLYKPCKQRLEILLWMISKLSESYGGYIDKSESENAYLDVAFKLSDLQFVKSSDKIAFAKGELPVKQQEEVFNKIVDSIFLIQLLQSKRNQGTTFKEHFKIQSRGNKLTKNAKEKKPRKPFDFNAARNHIKDAKKCVQWLESFKKEMAETTESQHDHKDNDNAEISELKTDFSACVSSLQFLSSYSYGVSEVEETELNATAVEHLHTVLQVFLKKHEKLPSEDQGITRKHNMNKPLEDINDLKKTSVILQLNELYSLTVKQ